MRKITTFLSAAVLLLAAGVTSTLHAGSVKFTLDLSSPGAFSLFAEELDGDNGGIASYGAVLTGGVTSVAHVSTFSQFSISPNGNGPIGFTQLRSAADDAAIGASQDTITPSPNILYGIGQSADSFTNLGYNDASGSGVGLDWDAKFLLATGTWEGETPGFNQSDARTFSNIFQSDSVTSTEAAALEFAVEMGGGGGDPIAVGTPASGSEISMQGAFDDGSGLLAQAIMVMNDNPQSDDPLTIGDLVISNESIPGLYSAQINSEDPTKIDILMDIALATQQADGALATADLVVNTNGGPLSYSLTARVPEPSTVALAGLALVGLVGFTRRK